MDRNPTVRSETERRTPVSSLLGLAGWLILTFAVAYWASQWRPGEWYGSLAKPAWTPPNWLFGPVWTLLYTAMAVAAWLVWRKHGFRRAAPALLLFLVQLALNGIWSWLFFGQHRIGLALVDIVVLLVAILITAALFWRHVKPAGILFLPYALWVAYASALNFQIWRLNN